MKKKKPLLHPMNDSLTAWVKAMMAKAKKAINDKHALCPTLIYKKDGVDFSIPLVYEVFVQAGKEMILSPEKAGSLMERMGHGMAHFSMCLAERADNSAFVAEDKFMFARTIECLVSHLAPEALVVIAPIKHVVAKGLAEAMIHAIMGPDSPLARPAVMVLGRTPIRTYGQVSVVSVTKSGTIRFYKPKVLDSFLGHREIANMFANVFLPNLN